MSVSTYSGTLSFTESLGTAVLGRDEEEEEAEAEGRMHLQIF